MVAFGYATGVWMGLVLLTLFTAGCQSTENIGYLTAGNDSENTGNDSESESGVATDTIDGSSDDSAMDSDTASESSDTASYTRVPFVVSDPEDYFYFRVNPEDNALGFYGGWYTYADGSGTANQMYFDVNNNACARGHVSQWYGDMNFWTFAGLGVGICYEPEVSTTCYTLNTCPYIDSLNVEVVGVAFELVNLSGASLRLQFLNQVSAASTYINELNTGDTVYLFADSIGSNPSSPTTFADVSNVQVQVENSETEDVEFDICLLNFSLIVRDAQ